jgi:hypothetical protein
LRDSKRTTPRFSIHLSVVVQVDGVRVEGTAVNVGMGGMFIAGPQLAYGQQVEVIAVVPGIHEELHLPGIVRWVDQQGFGVQFQLLGAHATFALTSLMARLAA